MKRLVLVSMIAVVAIAFTGCKKKEKSISEKLGDAAAQAQKAGEQAAKDAEKAGADLSKKLEGALNK